MTRTSTAIIHVIPATVFSNTFQGSYKDTISRVRYFESCEVDYRQIVLESDDPRLVLEAARGVDAPRFLFEYTSLRRTLAGVRSALPAAMIGARAHNIEPLQHWDNHGLKAWRSPYRVGAGLIRLAQADWNCKRLANVIYSISDWENRVYWNRLPGRARVEWLPYYCPDHLLPGDAATDDSSRDLIACFPTSQKNRKSLDLVTRFIRFAEHARLRLPSHYRFVVTGNLADWNLPPSPAVEFTGMVDDLKEFMARTVAVGMLSPLGYGFKTTIGDAIAYGCKVLTHPRLASRLPQLLGQSIIRVDTDRLRELDALAMSFEQFQGGASIDRELRRLNHQLLGRDYKIDVRPACSVTND